MSLKLEDGIFAYLRKKSFTGSISSFVNVSSSFETWSSSTNIYCKEPMTGGPPSVIVEDKPNTAWATMDYNISQNKSVELDFGPNLVYVSSFGMITLCQPSSHIILYGSIDNGKSWNLICEKKEALQEYSTVKITCSNPGSYSLFRLQQVGKNTNINIDSYRMHVYKVEFYGKFLNSLIFEFTCKKSKFSSHIFTIIYLLLLSHK